MLTQSDIDIPVPIFPESSGGEQPQWSSICGFDAPIPAAIVTRTLEFLKSHQRPAAFVYSNHELPNQEQHEGELVFRAKGFMEEACTQTAHTLHDIMGKLITASLTEIFLINHNDASKALAEHGKIKGYNVTRTVLDLLKQLG